MTVLDRIKKLAKKRDKSLKEVAFDIELSENSLYRFDKSIPNGQTLQKLADYFHVSVDYLLGRDDSDILPEKDWLEMLESQESYSGNPLSKTDKAILKSVVTAYLENRDKNTKE